MRSAAQLSTPAGRPLMEDSHAAYGAKARRSDAARPCSPEMVCCQASSAALTGALRQVEVAVSMTSERRVSRICSGRRPAQAASRIIPWMHGLR